MPFQVFLSILQSRKGGTSLAKGLLCWALKSITVVARRPLPPASSTFLSPGIFPNEIRAYFIPSQHLPLRPALNSPRASCCSYAMYGCLWPSWPLPQHSGCRSGVATGGIERRERAQRLIWPLDSFSLVFLFLGSFSQALNPPSP